MNYTTISFSMNETEMTGYYSNVPLPEVIEGNIIACYEVIYDNNVPQRVIALKEGTDSKHLDDLLMNLAMTVLTLRPTYIGIKDGKPC